MPPPATEGSAAQAGIAAVLPTALLALAVDGATQPIEYRIVPGPTRDGGDGSHDASHDASPDASTAGAGGAAAPRLVFLHEGLGSISQWRDFPDRLCARVQAPGLVYSRPGHGASVPRLPAFAPHVDFMSRQAARVLAPLLADPRLGDPQRPTWLVGHSDGASIALIHAARGGRGRIAGLVLIAPHLFVEPVTLQGIAQARQAWDQGDLRRRLARHHREPETAFGGWHDAWRDPAFATWTIEGLVDAIDCPILAIQGLDDAYGTLEQIRAIARRRPGTRLLELADCGHAPQIERPDRVLDAAAAFIRASAPSGSGSSATGAGPTRR